MTIPHCKWTLAALIFGATLTRCANDQDEKPANRNGPHSTETMAEGQISPDEESNSTDADANSFGLTPDDVPDLFIVVAPVAVPPGGAIPAGVITGDAAKLSRSTTSYALKRDVFSASTGTSGSGANPSGATPATLLVADYSQLPAMAVRVSGGFNAATMTKLTSKNYKVIPAVKMIAAGAADLSAVGFTAVPTYNSLVGITPVASRTAELLPYVAVLDMGVTPASLTRLPGRNFAQFNCAKTDANGAITCDTSAVTPTNNHGTDVAALMLDMLPTEIGLISLNLFPAVAAGVTPSTNSAYALKALNQILCMKKRWNAGERGSAGTAIDPSCIPRNIVAINLSFATGGSFNASQCVTPETSGGIGGPGGVIELLRAEKVSVVAAAGNSPTQIGLQVPACIPGAFSVGVTPVGGTYVTSVASYLKILAPGNNVTAAQNRKVTGTSFSAPFATGALALLAVAKPAWVPDERENRLVDLGKSRMFVINRKVGTLTRTFSVPSLVLTGLIPP